MTKKCHNGITYRHKIVSLLAQKQVVLRELTLNLTVRANWAK